MKKIYSALLLLFWMASHLSAQSVVVPKNLNGTAAFPFTDISDYISKDTTATGERKNKTYLLETGGLYFFTGEMKWTFDVELVATGNPALGRPIVARRNPSGATALPPLYSGFGSFTFDGLYVIMGEEGATASAYETTPFRTFGDNKRFVFNNCIFEKSRQGLIRLEGENCKVYVTNCIMRNFGDYERFQGNGRIVDPRDNYIDTVVIRNNVMHNVLDRLYIGFRQKGCKYFEFTQNTVFNHVGRHGMIQLKNAEKSIIKNNLFMNPSMMGTDSTLADEQINWFKKTNYLISIDTTLPNATMEISNNNIFWTKDVEDYLNTSTRVDKPMVLSPEVVKMLAKPDEAYFTEVLELNNVPSRDPVLKYCKEAVQFRDSVGITDIMVEDISYKGTAWDKGYLFDFSKFDPCYSPATKSAKAASDGGALGVRFLCSYATDARELVVNPLLGLSVSPNPVGSAGGILRFQLQKAGQVELSVHNLMGQKIQLLASGHFMEGEHVMADWNTSTLPKGFYLANLQTEEGRMSVKFIVQ